MSSSSARVHVGSRRPFIRLSAIALVVATVLAVAAVLYLVAAKNAWAQQVVADLSGHLIAITTGFTGTEVTLFGATDGVGDVIAVVRGPDTTRTVRRKDRVLGVWVNNANLTFEDVPSYYTLASSRPLEDFLPEEVAARHQIGLNALALPVAGDDPEAVPPETEAEFRAALIRRKQALGLFSRQVGRISFLGTRLFRYKLTFPSNVPTGDYTVTVFLVDRGEVVSAQSTPLQVSKVGVSASIFRFAHNYPGPYGIVAIFVAVVSGWLAGVVFRK